MGVYAGPEITSDGLVLALDAGNLKGFDDDENLISHSASTSGIVLGVIGSGGSLPTGWGIDQGQAGTTLEVVGYGVEEGLNYIDLKFSGTTSATNRWLVRPGNGLTLTSGVTYNSSLYAKTISGTPTDVRQFSVFGGAFGASLSGINSTLTRYSGSATFGATGTYYPRLDIGYNSISTVMNFTIRVAGFQAEVGSSASPYYATTGTAKNRGTTLIDMTGRGNSGTLTNGPTYSSANGGSLVFDGTNDYVTSSFATTSGQAVTYTGWLYSTETTATYRNFVDSVTARPMIWWNTSGQIEFDAAFYTTTTVYRNQWVYVALSKPSGSSSASYYVNGVPVGSGTAYTTPAVTPTWFNRAAAQTWKGNCSNVQAYNRALSAAEVQQNYNATKSRYIQDGSSADRAASSASYLSSIGIRADGDYWYLPPGQTTPIQLYTVFSSAPAGKGYVLVARGRESTDWWNTNGQNTSALTSTSINTNTPIAVLSNSFVNSLINSQWNGMRFITNRINGGDSWLFVGTTSTTFSWTYFQQSASSVNATATKYNSLFLSGGVALNWGSGANWTDTLNYGGGNNCDRTFTWSWGGHGAYQGWSGGSSCTPAGSFQNGGEGHSIQLVNCYVEC